MNSDGLVDLDEEMAERPNNSEGYSPYAVLNAARNAVRAVLP